MKIEWFVHGKYVDVQDAYFRVITSSDEAADTNGLEECGRTCDRPLAAKPFYDDFADAEGVIRQGDVFLAARYYKSLLPEMGRTIFLQKSIAIVGNDDFEKLGGHLGPVIDAIPPPKAFTADGDNKIAPLAVEGPEPDDVYIERLAKHGEAIGQFLACVLEGKPFRVEYGPEFPVRQLVDGVIAVLPPSARGEVTYNTDCARGADVLIQFSPNDSVAGFEVKEPVAASRCVEYLLYLLKKGNPLKITETFRKPIFSGVYLAELNKLASDYIVTKVACIDIKEKKADYPRLKDFLNSENFIVRDLLEELTGEDPQSFFKNAAELIVENFDKLDGQIEGVSGKFCEFSGLLEAFVEKYKESGSKKTNDFAKNLLSMLAGAGLDELKRAINERFEKNFGSLTDDEEFYKELNDYKDRGGKRWVDIGTSYFLYKPRSEWQNKFMMVLVENYIVNRKKNTEMEIFLKDKYADFHNLVFKKDNKLGSNLDNDTASFYISCIVKLDIKPDELENLLAPFCDGMRFELTDEAVLELDLLKAKLASYKEKTENEKVENEKKKDRSKFLDSIKAKDYHDSAEKIISLYSKWPDTFNDGFWQKIESKYSSLKKESLPEFLHALRFKARQLKPGPYISLIDFYNRKFGRKSTEDLFDRADKKDFINTFLKLNNHKKVERKKSTSWSFFIFKSGGASEKKASNSPPPKSKSWLLLFIVGAVAFGVISLFLFMIRQDKKEEPAQLASLEFRKNSDGNVVKAFINKDAKLLQMSGQTGYNVQTEPAGRELILWDPPFKVDYHPISRGNEQQPDYAVRKDDFIETPCRIRVGIKYGKNHLPVMKVYSSSDTAKPVIEVYSSWGTNKETTIFNNGITYLPVLNVLDTRNGKFVEIALPYTLAGKTRYRRRWILDDGKVRYYLRLSSDDLQGYASDPSQFSGGKLSFWPNSSPKATNFAELLVGNRMTNNTSVRDRKSVAAEYLRGGMSQDGYFYIPVERLY